MNIKLIYIVIILVLIGIVHAAAAREVALDSDVTKTLKLPDGAAFTVTISVGKWRSDPYKNASLWGAWGRTPKTVVALVSASLNKKPLYVPFSSYADLADPHTVEVRLKGNNVELEIGGSSGGLRYNAILVFAKGKYVSSRRVVDSDMPKDAREETKYFGVENY
jgi:hypothetical protein